MIVFSSNTATKQEELQGSFNKSSEDENHLTP